MDGRRMASLHSFSDTQADPVHASGVVNHGPWHRAAGVTEPLNRERADGRVR